MSLNKNENVVKVLNKRHKNSQLQKKTIIFNII